MDTTKRRHTPYSKFKAYLDENGIKQHELAVMMGKSKGALNQNLNGTGGDFSIKELRLLCELFGISADEYFIRPEVSNTKQIGHHNTA